MIGFNEFFPLDFDLIQKSSYSQWTYEFSVWSFDSIVLKSVGASVSQVYKFIVYKADHFHFKPSGGIWWGV